MERLVEFHLEDGSSVLVEADGYASGSTPVRGWGPGEISRRSEQTFGQAIERLGPAARMVIERLRSLPDTPDEINLEFELGFSANAGVYIAKMGGSANIKVSMTWHRAEQAGR
jgi:hypothetical protein